MSLASLRSYIFFLVFTTSCGNPTLQKDLENEEDKRKSAEQTSSELANEVALLKRFLTHIYVSTNNLWVVAGLSSSYEDANTQCTNIRYTLPASYDVEEFKKDVIPSHPELSKYMDQFQIDGEPAEQTTFWMVLCRIGRE